MNITKLDHALTWALLILLAIAILMMPAKADAYYMSHYGEGDGYMWKRTACGKIVRPDSIFVAALKPHLAKCGLKLTIWVPGHGRYHTIVQDRGAWRSDSRILDAAPGLRKRIGFRGVVYVSRYTKGWV